MKKPTRQRNWKIIYDRFLRRIAIDLEKSELDIYREELKKRLEDFFAKEGFEKTEIKLKFNSKDDYGNRIVAIEIKAVNFPYSNKN